MPAALPTTPLQEYLHCHYGLLLASLVRRLGCPELAMECLHEAWLSLADRRLPDIVDNPGGYVFRVACNIARNHYRGGVRDDGLFVVEDSGVEHVADDMADTDAIAQARVSLQRLMRELEAMPRRQRAVFVASRVEQLSRGEVARRFGISVGAVDSALRRAFSQLQMLR